MKYGRYDIQLLKELNEEYATKKLIPNYDQTFLKTPEWYLQQADGRIDGLVGRGADFSGKKILEIGCGTGNICHRISERFDCRVTGVDIRAHEKEWERYRNKNTNYLTQDLSQDNPFQDNYFDYIISFDVWEHVFHPFEMLQQASRILKSNGKFFLRANLYRSAVASHLYNIIYFPFPHLLFDPEIICQFAKEKNIPDDRLYGASLNKLTYAQYKEYFKLLGLEIEHEKLITRNIDIEFYARFEEKLGLYPIFDLELDFFYVTLVKSNTNFTHRKNITFTNFEVVSRIFRTFSSSQVASVLTMP